VIYNQEPQFKEETQAAPYINIFRNDYNTSEVCFAAAT